MPETEFVNPEFAKAEAKRAIDLLNQSDEARRDAWLALQAVADQVGPASNVGIRGITWSQNSRGQAATYYLTAQCKDGRLRATMAAPQTLEDARGPEWLDKAVALLARKVAEKGGLSKPLRRPNGTGAALVDAVSSVAGGRDWLDRQKTKYGAVSLLLRMVTVADAYGADGINPCASVHAHEAFLPFDHRVDLIREFPSVMAARAKAMSLRSAHDLPREVSKERGNIRESEVVRLAVRTGVTRAEARTILRARMDGRSKAKLIRAVNEAFRDEARESSKVAA